LRSALTPFRRFIKRLMRRKGMKATTIHTLIYTPFEDKGGRRAFALRTQAEMTARGFLVDEASMVSRELYEDLLSFGRPVIFCGDHGQLPPVGQHVNPMARPQHRRSRSPPRLLPVGPRTGP
jgi:hypothetical protein